RYTQHLALTDNKIDPSKEFWYKELWQIRFFKSINASRDGTSKWAYAVFSDKDSGSGYDGNPNATTGEVALEPQTKRLLSGGFTITYDNPKTYKKAAIEETYNIVDVRFSPACSYYGSKRIVFDYVGRPMRGNPASYTKPYTDANRLITQECKITFCFDDLECETNFTISIMPETGFSYISSINP
ncbi:MAG: type II/IV secretion system protein, partial [Epsilonproteobacteria bacterium]|nr:type II/IV secretion system protein [Campylobacterota bacterium]